MTGLRVPSRPTIPRSLRAAAVASLATAVLAPALASAEVKPELVAGPSVAEPQFTVRYTGKSHTKTRYRGTPPNPKGAADLNTANDEGRTSWALDYPKALAFPTCAVELDPCGAVSGVNHAKGKLRASGTIDHRHIDGLYDQLDSSARCSLRATKVPRRNLQAQITVQHDPARGWLVQAQNPLVDLLPNMPGACREPIDGIDRILGNYFWPSFSFSGDFVPDRWFTSEQVVIPDAVWRSSTRVRLRLGPIAETSPPRDCAAKYKYERCRTSNDWSGVLTFTRRAS